MKWSEEETLKFAELYRDSECLWNLASPKYKNKTLRQRAIENLAKDMGKEGFGIQKVKLKIKNLRSTYNQEVLKIKRSMKSGSGTEDVYTLSIKWFYVLDPIMKIRRGGTNETTSNLPESEQMDEETEALNENVETDDTPATSVDPQEVQATIMPHTPTTGPTHHVGVKTANAGLKRNAEAGPVKLRGNKRRVHELSHAVKDLRAVSEIINQSEEDFDENEAFGQYVAKSLNKMFVHDAVCAQHDMQSILKRYRLNSCTPLPTSSKETFGAASTSTNSSTTDFSSCYEEGCVLYDAQLTDGILTMTAL